MSKLTYEELTELVGKEFADKAFKVECVYKYLYANIPQISFASGYGWDEVGRKQTLENEQRKSIREIAMMGAISVVLDKPPDVAKKMAAVIGPWFWDNETRQKAELFYELKNKKEE